MQTFVAYYRVSTQKQGRSGLGLDAQRSDVEKYVTGKGILIAEFTEVESGRKNNRQQLQTAIAKAKENSAVLVVAKLDRLSRDAGFTIQLSNSDVNFVCVDNPHINKMTIGILSLVNQDEAERTSLRTKMALAEKRKKIEQGNYTNSTLDPVTGQHRMMKPDKKGIYRLGNPNGYSLQMSRLGVEAIKRIAANNKNTIRAKNVIRDALRADPTVSLSFLANRLNAYGLSTTRNKTFTKYNVAYLTNVVREELKKDGVK
ncbi:recombinase family protein [Xanthocytophaga agilis]|uniref:Recombinase family protein n=1 Tax=Xanthocytophaga agilis TaxID=3048010 RepID=A0AAE3R8D1_9BACT|nr:recombinase family protein [Xanthocytophaga agilis]MDJ1505634.1 recombinase family protein [Xanthocytophaga agilis]